MFHAEQKTPSLEDVLYGPKQNRTAVSAMRMRRTTAVL